MRLLLLNAPVLFIGRLLREHWWNSSPQLHLIYSFLKKQGIEVEVYDAIRELGLPRGELAGFFDPLGRELSRRTFDVVGVSCATSFQYLGAMRLGELLRAEYPEMPLVVGGRHPTAVPSDFLGEDSPFDWVVRGPGEQVLAELCLQGASRRPAPEVIEGEPVPLDDIVNDWTYPYDECGVFLSRGCPHCCVYCSESSRYDCSSVDHAALEFSRAATHGHHGFVHVQDALFGLDKNWRRSFLERLVRRETKARLGVEMRVEQLELEDIELLGALKAYVFLGVESGSPQVLRIMQKTKEPKRYLERCREVLEAFERCGVEYSLGVIYNHPGETEETLQESIDFFWRLFWDGPSSFLNELLSHPYYYLPGSPMEHLRPNFEQEHGTIIHHPTWWREPELDHVAKSEDVTASSGFSIERATQMANRLEVANWMIKARK